MATGGAQHPNPYTGVRWNPYCFKITLVFSLLLKAKDKGSPKLFLRKEWHSDFDGHKGTIQSLLGGSRKDKRLPWGQEGKKNKKIHRITSGHPRPLSLPFKGDKVFREQPGRLTGGWHVFRDTARFKRMVETSGNSTHAHFYIQACEGGIYWAELQHLCVSFLSLFHSSRKPRSAKKEKAYISPWRKKNKTRLEILNAYEGDSQKWDGGDQRKRKQFLNPRTQGRHRTYTKFVLQHSSPSVALLIKEMGTAGKNT